MADTRQVGSLWTPEEDVILLQHVARYGTKHWGSLQSSSTLPHRDQKACCNRFILLKRKFFQARAKGQNLQTIFPYINVNSQPSSPSAAVASSMLHAPASPTSTEVALRVNVSSRVITKRAAAPSLSKPAILQSALATVQEKDAYGGGSVWMPNLVDAQRSPAVSDPSSPLSASHGRPSLQQEQQQQQLQQLLVTIGQSANAVSQAAMQFVNAASSVNPSTPFSANHVSQQQPQSPTSPAGRQSAADAVVNMILRKLAGDASSFAKHPVASAASPASSKSDVSVEPASAATPFAPLHDASSRPSSAAPRRPPLLSAPQRGPAAVVPSAATSAGSFPADSGASLQQQVVPGWEGETQSDDDMLLAYLYARGHAQGHAQSTAPEGHKKETRAECAAVEVEKQQEQQVQQVARQEEAKQEAMASDAADMSLLLQLHEEVMALEKLVAAGASAATAATAAPSTTPAAASTSALAPLPPRASNASFSSAAASGASVALDRSASQRPDAVLEQVSSAPGRMLFGFSPVYDLMAPGASWDAHAAAGDEAGWDLKEMVDVSAFNLDASATFLA